ncbi:DUF934 domain-containing protein [Aquicoccus sp. SCR17]|nr:DUF934 domain-containing protein [Carideicomes alvinocaridis]
MSVIVTDSGFGADDWAAPVVPMEEAGPGTTAVAVPSDAEPLALADFVSAQPDLMMIRINFPSHADGRGFTLARQLRLAGYEGRLRAEGHVIADQYAMARRSGFDEVEISDELAQRQPEDQWLFRADWKAHDYQSRLRG